MKVFENKNSLKEHLNFLKQKKKTVGFVPTMGALHEGHLSLIEKAKQGNDHVVVSIFVNPTQFDNKEDLDKYPRTVAADLKTIGETEKNISVFIPSAEDLYDGKIEAKHYNFGSLEKVMEGKYRSGHFDGVGTVVSLLLKAVYPDRVYFGEKDFQQLQIIKKLVKIEKIDVEIISVPIARENNGLARSSRNKRLTKTQFDEAALIYQTLCKAKEKFATKSIAHIRQFVEETFRNNPNLTLEYFEIANEKNLRNAQNKMKNNAYRAFIAAYAGKVRLIDNMALN